jgi:hypothetical protein
MARFDDEFAKLQVRLQAALDVIAAHPEIAAEVKAAVDVADVNDPVAEGLVQDEARANVIVNLLANVDSTLQAVGDTTTGGDTPQAT